MTTSTRILKALESSGVCQMLLTRQLAAQLGVSASAIRNALRGLQRRGLVVSREGVHQLTIAGQEWLDAGKVVTSGPDKGQAHMSHNRTLRARAWRVMRMMRIFSVDDVAQVICDGEERGGLENLIAYCKALHKAGITGKARRTGHYHVREGVTDGPEAPSYNRQTRTVTCRNTGEVFCV